MQGATREYSSTKVKPGHYMKDSRKKKTEEDGGIRNKEKHEKKNNESNVQAAFSVEATETEFRNLAAKNVWILDSGASKYMTFQSDWLCNLQR